MARRGAGHNKENDTDITEALAKKLDKKMEGKQVIWNDPEANVPLNKGYTDAKDVRELVNEILHNKPSDTSVPNKKK
jgi:hypothetical protein